jgi:hypothetical protein
MSTAHVVKITMRRAIPFTNTSRLRVAGVHDYVYVLCGMFDFFYSNVQQLLLSYYLWG